MDKSGLFQIGEVAGMYHISVGSLRHYERLGLVTPEYVDRETGYRYYSTRQFERLNTIRYLRMLDMPLDQIGSFLDNRDLDRMWELLCQQKEVVARRRRELEVIERKIDNRLEQLRDAEASELDVIRLTLEPARRIALLRNWMEPGAVPELEKAIRQLDRDQEETLVFLGKVGVGITRERLEQGAFDRYDLVFLQLDPEEGYTGEVEELPEETCVTVRFRGGHREAREQYEKLMAFIGHHRLRPSGFSREITLIDNGLTSDPEKFVTEIQIPVET